MNVADWKLPSPAYAERYHADTLRDAAPAVR